MVVLLLVDGYDLATIAALKYARGLRPTVLRTVHFSLDGARADQLRRQWVDAGTGIPLELADCPDRRLSHAAARLATSLAAVPGTHVTVVLPRRCYPPLVIATLCATSNGTIVAAASGMRLTTRAILSAV